MVSGVEWWESFFDGDYVEAWTAAGSFSDTEALVDDVEALLGLQSGSEILDIACGFGRVAGPLSQRGFRSDRHRYLAPTIADG